MPRVKSDAERGWVSAWLRKQRVQRGWSPEQVIDHLPAPVRVDYYRGLEAGRKPGPELLAAFEAMYGPVPPEPPREQPDNGDMAAAIRELVEEVRLSRLASDRNADVLAQLLGVVLSGRLPQPETEAADAPLVRQGNG